MRRWIKRTLVVASVTIGGVATAGVVVIGPRNIWGMVRYDTRREGDLEVGDAAPDAELLDLEGAHAHLRDRLGSKPTVFIFGSFT